MMKQHAIIALAATVSTVVSQDTTPAGPTMTGSPSNCNAWYTIVKGDDCPSVEKKFGITADQFFKWNPAVSKDCTTNFWVGESYCVGVAESDPTPGGPTMTGSPSNCNAWYTIKKGDDCPSVEKKFGITADQFFKWNPAVSKDCATNFWVGEAYCVGVGAAKPTTSEPTTSKPTKTTSSTSLKTTSEVSTPYSIRNPITSQNITQTTKPTAWPPTKTQQGQPSYCNNWHYVTQGDTCQNIVNEYGAEVTLQQFFEWNPFVGKDCSGLFNGWFVCVGIQPQSSSTFEWYTSATNATVPPPTAWTPTMLPTINSSFTASPQQTGVPSDCQAFWQASANDNCNTALEQYPYLTKDLFMKWNPALKGDCQGLWSGYWYCVADFKSGDMPQPPTTTKPGKPAESGAPSDCKSWYQTSDDDTCDVIVQMFGTFSKSDFTKWNPSVLSDCSEIEDGVYYCVGVAGTPTTRSSPAGTTTEPTSLPTQSGTVANCSQYWLVSDGDTCQSISSANGINLKQLITWNPALNNNGDCQLKQDTYVCVAVGDSASTTPEKTSS